MFDRLEDLLKHYEELMLELNEPSVADDQKRFRKLMKEQADLAPLVETYTEYKKANQDVEDSLALLDEEGVIKSHFSGSWRRKSWPTRKSGSRSWSRN